MMRIKVAASVMAVAVTCMLTGCNTLQRVESELKKGGFTMWYPPEEDISPYDIWAFDGRGRTSIERAPEQLTPRNPNGSVIEFTTMKKEVDANILVKANVGEQLLGEVGKLKAEFETGTVRDVALDFGDTRVYRIDLGDLKLARDAGELPAGDARILTLIQNGNRDYVLLAAVVRTEGMLYKLTVEDSTKFDAGLEGAIEGVLGVDVTINVKSETEVELSIPSGTTLAIGFSRLRPKYLDPGITEVAIDTEDDLEYIRLISEPFEPN
mgnify:FL=1